MRGYKLKMNHAGMTQPGPWEMGEAWGASRLPACDTLPPTRVSVLLRQQLVPEGCSGLPQFWMSCHGPSTFWGDPEKHSFSFILSLSPGEEWPLCGRVGREDFASYAFIATFSSSAGLCLLYFLQTTQNRTLPQWLHPGLRRQFTLVLWDVVENQFLSQIKSCSPSWLYQLSGCLVSCLLCTLLITFKIDTGSWILRNQKSDLFAVRAHRNVRSFLFCLFGELLICSLIFEKCLEV